MSRGEKLIYASEVYRMGGYGILDLSVANALDGGGSIQIRTPSSHYGFALCLNFEPQIEPGELFDLGYAIGALSAVYGKPFNGKIDEGSISMGGSETMLRLWAGDDGYQDLFTLEPSIARRDQAPGAFAEVPPKTYAPNIDEALIIGELAKVSLVGDPVTGLIPAFGVNLTHMFADYYNLISYHFEKRLTERMEDFPGLAEILVYNYPTLFYFQQYFRLEGLDLIKAMFIEAGHVCGFNTMGGIMNSDAWKQLVLPMIQTRDDWLQGIVSCINALGWGIWRIAELLPNERLVLRSWYPYESLGYLRWFGIAPHGVDYCMAGVAGSIMNLMYEGDITSYPELNSDYYNKVNRSENSFWVDQTRCVAMGDEYSEIVVTRKPRH